MIICTLVKTLSVWSIQPKIHQSIQPIIQISQRKTNKPDVVPSHAHLLPDMRKGAVKIDKIDAWLFRIAQMEISSYKHFQLFFFGRASWEFFSPCYEFFSYIFCVILLYFFSHWTISIFLSLMNHLVSQDFHMHRYCFFT